MAKKLSEYSDGIEGVWVFFHKNPPKDVPSHDKIQIVFESIHPNESRQEHWLHEEEALSLVSGLSQAILQTVQRMPIRKGAFKERDRVNGKTDDVN